MLFSDRLQTEPAFEPFVLTGFSCWQCRAMVLFEPRLFQALCDRWGCLKTAMTLVKMAIFFKIVLTDSNTTMTTQKYISAISELGMCYYEQDLNPYPPPIPLAPWNQL